MRYGKHLAYLSSSTYVSFFSPVSTPVVGTSGVRPHAPSQIVVLVTNWPLTQATDFPPNPVTCGTRRSWEPRAVASVDVLRGDSCHPGPEIPLRWPSPPRPCWVCSCPSPQFWPQGDLSLPQTPPQPQPLPTVGVHDLRPTDSWLPSRLPWMRDSWAEGVYWACAGGLGP